MLTVQQINDGYTLVFKGAKTPSAPEISFWQALSSDGSISSADFPQKLAAQTLLSNAAEEITTLARNYLWYEDLEEVLRVPANWKEPVVERISFNTDVLTSRSGREQRFRLLRKPRITIEYATLLMKLQLQHYVNQIQRVQGKATWIPLWHEVQKVGFNGLGGWDLENLARIRAGKFLLFSSYGKFELVDIVKVGDSFFFEHPPETSYFSNPLIVPVEKGNIHEKLPLEYISATVATGRVISKLQPHYPLKISSPPSTQMIGGVHVMPFEHNWLTPARAEVERQVHVLDYGTGPQKVYDLRNYSDTTKTVDFFGYKSKYGIRDFFLDCAGRAAEFYCPTFVEDLILPSNFSYVNGQKFLTVMDTGFAEYYAGSKLSKYIWIEFKDRPATICKIELPTSTNGLERIPVLSVQGSDDPFGFGWNASQVHRISYLPKCRFHSDTLEVGWINAEIYRASTSFITVQ